MTLGLRIRTLRKAHKMTQQELADLTDVSRIHIQALESNRRSPADLLEEFPRDTGGRLQLEELFAGPEPMEIWYRSHKLSERDMAMVHRLIEAALADWEGDSKRAKKGAKR